VRECADKLYRLLLLGRVAAAPRVRPAPSGDQQLLGGKLSLSNTGDCVQHRTNASFSDHMQIFQVRLVSARFLPAMSFWLWLLLLMPPCLLVNVCLLLVWCTVACALVSCCPGLPPLLLLLRGC
jgi:hypothetical protein